MKRSRRLLVSGVCALTAFLLVCETNLFAEDVADKGTIIGTVYAVAWDDHDEATAATITTSSGEEYAIVDDAVGRKLLKLDNRVVKASGIFSKDSEGNKTFSVTQYEIMPE
jgi:hypothetical protein